MKLKESDSKNKKVIIIAEAGVNHNGDFQKALELIDVAAESGADFIKFQTFQAEKLASNTAGLASYQELNTNYASQSAMLKNLELKYDWHQDLIDYSNKKIFNESTNHMSSQVSIDYSIMKKLALTHPGCDRQLQPRAWAKAPPQLPLYR